MERISIHVCTRNRPVELCLLLQSLRTQKFKRWDLVIVDECDQSLETNYFFHCIINRIRLEEHYVNIVRNDLRLGVCNARNLAIKSDYFDNQYVCRVDDDVILESDYLTKLISVIKKGYDISSGVTPTLNSIPFERDNHNIKSIINKKIFDSKGNIINYGDDCGTLFIKDEIKRTHEFRSCALMKKVVIQDIEYENNLSPVGFREEAFFSFRALSFGYRIGVHTGAIAWHFQSPQGGCRFPDYPQKVQSDDKYFKKWAKKLYLEDNKFKKNVTR